MKKLMNALALTADLMPGILMAVAGLGVIVGGATGVLWY